MPIFMGSTFPARMSLSPLRLSQSLQHIVELHTEQLGCFSLQDISVLPVADWRKNLVEEKEVDPLAQLGVPQGKDRYGREGLI